MRGGLDSHVEVAAALNLGADANVSPTLRLIDRRQADDACGYSRNAKGAGFDESSPRQAGLFGLFGSELIDLVVERFNLVTNPPLGFRDRALDLLRAPVTTSHNIPV